MRTDQYRASVGIDDVLVRGSLKELNEVLHPCLIVRSTVVSVVLTSMSMNAKNVTRDECTKQLVEDLRLGGWLLPDGMEVFYRDRVGLNVFKHIFDHYGMLLKECISSWILARSNASDHSSVASWLNA